mmetsp:Transcript_33786/g.79126  ORF Transcript_33786/g.79126 Transcript_33786/m.79126 type:complete len:106 (-) Transcript_33786:83-400(-)
MLRLLLLGYVDPTLSTLHRWSQSTDLSLVRYFLVNMFAQIQPPFTAQFVGQVLRVVVADEKTLGFMMHQESRESVSDFLHHCDEMRSALTPKDVSLLDKALAVAS